MMIAPVSRGNIRSADSPHTQDGDGAGKLLDRIGRNHAVLGSLNRPGIPRIIPESIKANQVQISVIDEEAQNLMADRVERKPLAALSQERESLTKQCRYPGCLEVSGDQGKSGAVAR